MATLREKRNPVRIFVRRLTLLGLFLLVVLAMSGVWGIYRKDQESVVLKEQALSQLAVVSAQQDQLKASIADLQTARGKEAALRQQYNMGNSGEGMVVIVEPPKPTPVAATSSSFQAWFSNAFPWW